MQPHNVPSTVAPEQRAALEFARNLHAAENALCSVHAGTRDPVAALGEFLETQVVGQAAFTDMTRSMLIDHSLWRVLNVPELRDAAVKITPFLDPFNCGVEQAVMVTVLSRFIETDPAVREFLSQVDEGSAAGLIMLNGLAIGKARQKLASFSESPQAIPSQEEDLKLVGLT